jgi:uncharacterized membrane protein YtjA (UPF0391 family)
MRGCQLEAVPPVSGAASLAGLTHPTMEVTMIYWAAVFFIIAIVAGYFGFSGVSQDTAYIAKILAVVGIVLAVFSFLLHRGREV